MQPIEFGTDGVRGEAGSWPMNSLGALRIGQGVGAYLKEKTASPCVLIGRDTRQSGDTLMAALASGLLSRGVRVLDVGVIPTAGVAYLTKRYGLDIGAVISASHNPYTENGIKLISPDGLKLPDETERLIEGHISEAGNGSAHTADFGHFEQRAGWIDDYIAHLIAPFADVPFTGLRIALDCSNGAASYVAPRCFALLGCETVVLHATPTGKNINHRCGSEEVRSGASDLPGVARASSANLAAAFDGDADRAIFVDEAGNLIDGDHVLYILGLHLKAQDRLAGDVVVTTQMANSGLDMALKEQGIATIRTRVGDRYVMQEMLANDYVLGGEQSGHIILYDDWHTTGDGIYTALTIASVLIENSPATLQQLAAPMPKLPQVIASAQVVDKRPLAEMDAFNAEYEQVTAELGGEATVNVRYSGTEKLVRVMVEGTTAHSMADVTRQALRLARIVQVATGTDPASAALDVKDCATGASLDLKALGLE
jgi:phosphoglucosamine mutase